ncbi:armadillo-type protein [Mycena latifolia]|nr:armadillo-type protein [Mycena latifolia]
MALVQRELQNLDTQSLRKACRIFGAFIGHDLPESQETIHASQLGCASLVSLLGNSQAKVRDAAGHALFQISGRSEEGARTIVDAEGLPDLIQLLHSADSKAAVHISQVLGNIVSYRILSQTAIDEDGTLYLAELLAHPMFTVRSVAVQALHQMAENSDTGLYAIIDAKTLCNLINMLLSQETELTKCACGLLRSISGLDDRSLDAVVDAGACYPLCQLLRHADITVRLAAISALSPLSRSVHGAYDIFDGNGLAALGDLFHDSDTDLLRFACEVVENMILLDLELAVIDSGICAVLVSFLRHEESPVNCDNGDRLLRTRLVVKLLGILSFSAAGAHAAADAGAILVLVNLLAPKLSERDIRDEASTALTRIVDVAMTDTPVEFEYVV